jgi:peptidoglycan hydrolase CwlO-like protein
MKKMIFAALAAFVMSLAFTSCSSGDKADQMLNDMEALVQKVEAAKGDPVKLLEVLGEFESLSEKYKDVDENSLTDAQKKRLEELTKKLDF